MLRQITTDSAQLPARSFLSFPWPARPPRPACVECHRTHTPLYEMNGQRYCGSCLHTWCLSLPEVQADLLVLAQREQEG